MLRILRGSPDGLTCGEIGNRMITRDPDITRLVDRLERRKLVARCREMKDRRMVLSGSLRRVWSSWPGWMRRCRAHTANCLAIWVLKRLKMLKDLLAEVRSGMG